MKKYIEGIKFGMILQLIIGPMCLLVFNTSRTKGFVFTIPLILVIALVDVIYISLACIGVSNILKKKKLIKIFKLVGALVLIIFGLNTILNVFGINIIPGFKINLTTKNAIIQGFLLALSNPITIMFWGSVLTTKIIEDKMKKKDLIKFCFGLVSATLLFLSFVAFISSLLGRFIPLSISKIINILVGILIIYFGLERIFKKDSYKKKYKLRSKNK